MTDERTPPANKAIPASLEALTGLLEDRRKPLLWVGAGASVAAGYPSTSSLIAHLRAKAHPGDIPDELTDFTRVVDAFVAANGEGELADLLHDLFSPPHPPTALHRAVARLAGAGKLAAKTRSPPRVPPTRADPSPRIPRRPARPRCSPSWPR